MKYKVILNRKIDADLTFQVNQIPLSYRGNVLYVYNFEIEQISYSISCEIFSSNSKCKVLNVIELETFQAYLFYLLEPSEFITIIK